MNSVNKRTSGLLNASLMKRQQVMERTQQTLILMEQDEIPINFESVANMANVSKVWLYNQKEIAETIRAKRDKTTIAYKNVETKRLLRTSNAELQELKLKLKEQDLMIKKLKDQLEVVYGELYSYQKDKW